MNKSYILSNYDTISSIDEINVGESVHVIFYGRICIAKIDRILDHSVQVTIVSSREDFATMIDKKQIYKERPVMKETVS